MGLLCLEWQPSELSGDYYAWCSTGRAHDCQPLFLSVVLDPCLVWRSTVALPEESPTVRFLEALWKETSCHLPVHRLPLVPYGDWVIIGDIQLHKHCPVLRHPLVLSV